IATATPMVGTLLTLLAGRDEADALVDVAQGRLGDRAGLLRTATEYVGQVGLVVEELERALAEGSDEVDHDLRELLLEVAVAASCVLRLEIGDRAGGERRVDRQQVADARLVLGVEPHLGLGV